MDMRDKLLMREGTISDLVAMLDDWFSKADGFSPSFEVSCRECRGSKIKWDCCFDKCFDRQKDIGDLASYLFDLDVNGWSVQVSYLRWQYDFHECLIVLERFTD